MLITKTITVTRRDRAGRPPLSDDDVTIARTILLPRQMWYAIPEPRAATVRRLIAEYLACQKRKKRG